MNAELKSPLIVLTLAVIAWAGINFAGTVVEKRGKEENERRLAGLSRESDAARDKAREGRGAPVLVKPRVDAPVEIASAETSKGDSIAAVAPAQDGQPKVGTVDAPVP